MSGQVCSRCGGPLDPEAKACPWCGTPVVRSSPVSYQRPDWMWHSDEDDGDPGPSARAILLSGAVILAFGGILLALYAWISLSCSGGGNCDAGELTALVVLGTLLVLLGTGTAVYGYHNRSESGIL